MKCPFCQQEMDLGSLSAAGYQVLWTRKTRRFTNICFPGDVRLPTAGQISEPEPSAWHCPRCRKVIVDY